MKHLIEEFASSDLFGRENYEFYARVTGRVLRVQGEWICSFQYPPPPGTNKSHGQLYANQYNALEQYLLGQLSMEAEKTWLQCECERWRSKYSLEAMSQVDECQSTPALAESGLPNPTVSSTSLGMIAEHGLLESCTRLSISLEQNGFFQTSNGSRSSSQSSKKSQTQSGPRMTLEELRDVNRYAESTRSLSYLPQVHERQTERMRTRSQWFLAPSVECTSCGGSLDIPLNEADMSAITNALLRRSSSGTIVGAVGLSLSAESVQKRPSIRRSNSRDKRAYLHRSTSRRNKENSSRSNSFKGRGAVNAVAERRGSNSRSNSIKLKYPDGVSVSRSCSFKAPAELCSCVRSADGSAASAGTTNPTTLTNNIAMMAASAAKPPPSGGSLSKQSSIDGTLMKSSTLINQEQVAGCSGSSCGAGGDSDASSIASTSTVRYGSSGTSAPRTTDCGESPATSPTSTIRVTLTYKPRI